MGLLGLVTINKQGLRAHPHAYTSHSGLWLCKGLRIPGAKIHPKRGHNTASARSRRQVQILNSRSGRRGAPWWFSHSLSDGAPRRSFYIETIYLSRSVAVLVCVREKRLYTAMVTACFPVEKLRAVQHRGDSRVGQRAVTGRLIERSLLLTTT